MSFREQIIAIIRRLIFIHFVFLFLISGCNYESNVSAPEPLVSQTPCESVSICLPEIENSSSRLYYFLIEGTPNYYPKANIAKEIIVYLLPHILLPGDRVIVAWIEPSTLKESIFLDAKIGNLDFPILQSTPTKKPIPTIAVCRQCVTPESFSGIEKATTEALRAEATVAAESTKISIEYSCAQYEWWVSEQEKIDNWDNQQEINRQNVILDIINTININEAGQQDSKSHLFEAFEAASRLISHECDADCKAKLIIFSNFDDYRKYDPPDTITINLVNTTIVPVLLDCRYLFDNTNECSVNVSIWSNILEGFGSDEVLFVSKYDVTNELITILEGE